MEDLLPYYARALGIFRRQNQRKLDRFLDKAGNEATSADEKESM
jgi:hypothetical protein